MIKNTLGIVFLGIIVIAAIIYGLNSSGSPWSVRQQKFDTQRVSDINMLKSYVDSYYQNHSVLPTSLDQVKSNSLYGSSTLPTDPETKTSYTYTPGLDASYSLCATFTTSNQNTTNTSFSSYYDNTYKHPKGYYCFNVTAPQPYKPLNGGVYNAPPSAPASRSGAMMQ